jgi:choline dehydrogenase
VPAYLRPAMRRPILKVVSQAQATRILFDGRRAVGVEYRRRGKIESAQADLEVILSAGSVNSPQLLQLSGVGPVELLRRHEMRIVQDMPAVGRNLQDHLGMDHLYSSRLPTLNNELFPWHGKLRAGLKICADAARSALLERQPGGWFRPYARRPDAAEHPALLLAGQLSEGAARHATADEPRSLCGLPARLLDLPAAEPRAY